MNSLSCGMDGRREAVRAHEGWNGLDFVEVDNAQTKLTVYFLGKAPAGIGKANIHIDGGRSEKDHVQVVAIDIQRSESSYLDDRVLVQVDKPGDYSTYTLRLVGIEKVDPRYAAVDFSFKANCPTDLDCAEACGCQPEVYAKTTIDYLAKDYAGFRQLVLDRLALICPDWRERHVPDLGIALVEVLAYTGDYLSYYQDAVATEAYLDTARRRPSVRRHARLVDYTLSEGCNARALIALEAVNDIQFKAADVVFITGVNHLLPIGERSALQSREIEGLAAGVYEVFQPMAAEPDIHVRRANNRISIYTWGARECCIRRGATTAYLMAKEHHEDGSSSVRLQAGDLLIFEELLGPVTGQPGDADPQHRQAVRLTRVDKAHDDLLNTPLIEIEWSEEDALRFDLCVAAVGSAPECRYLEDISVARGNIILVDHGRPVGPENLGVVPVKSAEQCCECEGQASERRKVAGRYRPQLQAGRLTFAAPISATASAVALLSPDVGGALPVIRLSSSDGDWIPRSDLLSSSGDDRHFVVEMEENGIANILFGGGELGHQPAAGSEVTAWYRIGNGTAGNVGPGAISLLVHKDSDLSNDLGRIWNPLPAQGGTPSEPMAEAKLNAPYAFRFGSDALQRAITADDYARIAERQAKIQRAAARLTWTGSWYEAEVGLDVKAVYSGQSSIAEEVERYLEAYRRIGHDLEVRPAEMFPIDLALHVCIAPEYQKGHVKAALLDVFSSRPLIGGKLGFFHPDSLTFGDDIYLSAVVGAAQAIPGVVSVHVKRLQQQMYPSNQEIENGVLPLGPFKIARLDRDPNYPDRGLLDIVISGGRG